MIDAGSHLLFDARPAPAYDAGHLPGALSLPASDLDAALPQWQAALGPDQPVIVYCAGGACTESLPVAAALRGVGVREVLVFAGGYLAWTADGHATER
jgi:rhodanese-related sulfurtransferase